MSCRLRSMRWVAPFCMAGPCLSSMCDAALPMGMAAAPATAPTAPASISCDGDLQQDPHKIRMLELGEMLIGSKSAGVQIVKILVFVISCNGEPSTACHGFNNGKSAVGTSCKGSITQVTDSMHTGHRQHAHRSQTACQMHKDASHKYHAALLSSLQASTDCHRQTDIAGGTASTHLAILSNGVTT